MLRSLSAALVAAAGTLVPLLTGGFPLAHVQAAGAPPPPPSPFATLALPEKAFPTDSHVVTGTITASSSPSELHANPSGLPGWTGGVRQTVTWNVAGRKERTWPVSLVLSVRVFVSGSDAAAYCGEARAALWETGVPVVVSPTAAPQFDVARNNKTATFAALCGGRVEVEARLLRGVKAPEIQADLLHRLARRALQRGERLFPAVPAPAPPAVAQLPAITEAPWGTGPVIKSPSLMSPRSGDLPAGARLLPGAPRADVPLARMAHVRVALAPDSAIAEFRAVATIPGGENAYTATSLFASAATAQAAVNGMAAIDDAALSVRAPDADIAAFPGLGEADEIREWEGERESVLAVRYANVLFVLADAPAGISPLLDIAQHLMLTVPTPLHAMGTQVVDAADRPVHMAGLNWYGAESADFVVGGLDYTPYTNVLQAVRQLGYNTIRIPFSDQMVEQNPLVTAHLAANPGLQGLHALDILDRIISYAGALGISVILDNHRSEAGWSAEANGLWYTAAYPESAFDRDWSVLAARYAGIDTVIAADLRNEPHAAATWGTGIAATDWQAAAQRAGDAVLAANPNMMVMVEGVQKYGTAPSYWWGGNLMGVSAAPVQLQYANGAPARDKLVYSIHDYGPGMCGGGCPWFGPTTQYSTLASTWDSYWGYITRDPNASYAAPVWVGEFGTCTRTPLCLADPTPGSQGQWFSSFVQYLHDRNLSWMLWAANATQSTSPVDGRTYGMPEGYGLLGPGWVGSTALQQALQSIMSGSG